MSRRSLKMCAIFLQREVWAKRVSWRWGPSLVMTTNEGGHLVGGGPPAGFPDRTCPTVGGASMARGVDGAVSKGKAKISSMNRLNCVTDLLTHRNTGCLLSLYTSCSSNCLLSQSLLSTTDCETWLEVETWFETRPEPPEGWDTVWAETWNK